MTIVLLCDIGDRVRLGNHFGAVVSTGPATAATNASPVVLTVPGWHTTQQPAVGQTVRVSGVLGNTGANGTFAVQAATETTVTLTGSVGNGTFTSSPTSKVELMSTGAFKDAAGADTDPTAVVLRAKKPDGTLLVYGWPTAGASGTLTREQVGRVFLDYTFDAPGLWHWRLEGTGAIESTDEWQVFVRRSRVL